MTVADALRRQWYEFPSSRVEQPYADALRMFLERKTGELMSAPGWAMPEASLPSPPAIAGLDDLAIRLPAGTTSITVCRTQSYITISAADGLVLHQIKR
jgi:hypothetical protein